MGGGGTPYVGTRIVMWVSVSTVLRIDIPSSTSKALKTMYLYPNTILEQYKKG
jgi:hypothetical protein